MFKYKTKAEIDALTDAQLETYMAEKKTHEDGLRAKEIKDAVDAAKTEMQTAADAAAKKLVDEAVAAQKKITDDALEQIGKLKEQQVEGKSRTEGTMVKFFKESIAEAKAIDGDNLGAMDNRNYSKRTTIKAAALMTTADVLPNVAGGFSPLFGNYIDYEIGHLPLPAMIFMDLVTVKSAPGTENIYFSDRVNIQGDAAFIAEGTTKPLVSAQWQTTSKKTCEVALRWKQSKRLMAHAPSVIADFAERANEFMEQKVDDEILEGVSSATDFDGLQAVGTAFIVPGDLAAYYTFASIYDVIMACASQIRIANFKGNITATLNTVWQAKMQGVKDALGNYIIPPFVTKDGLNVGEVAVKFSNKVNAADIVVGVLKNYNLVVAENVSYDEGYENDDFSKNLVSKKLEAFMGSYVKLSNAGSIIYDQIATILTAIEVPAV
jgi:hypothetical protein